MPPTTDDKTHFGFEKVAFDEKSKKVANVFHSVANNYDLMNDLMSFGIHRLWKQFTIELAAIRPSHWILDLAAGTGDLSLKMAPLIAKKGTLIVSDINSSMLHLARQRMINAGCINQVDFVQINAETIPFPDNTFDLVTIGFGLRNVTHKESALKSIYRVLKPGGRVLILEFSQTTNPLLTKLYNFYSFSILPLLGRHIANDEQSYRYLAESIRMHPNQTALCQLLEQSGFEKCEYINLTGGVVAVHRGYKLD